MKVSNINKGEYKLYQVNKPDLLINKQLNLPTGCVYYYIKP